MLKRNGFLIMYDTGGTKTPLKCETGSRESHEESSSSSYVGAELVEVRVT